MHHSLAYKNLVRSSKSVPEVITHEEKEKKSYSKIGSIIMEEILNFIISHNAAFIKRHDFGILSCNQYS